MDSTVNRIVCTCAIQILEVLILLVLLVWWLENFSPDSGYEFLDFFAGKARLAQLAEARGYRAEAYDKDFGELKARTTGKRSSMDINSNAGMVCLATMQRTMCTSGSY